MLSSNPPPQSAHVECPLIIIDPILPPHTLLYLRPSLAQTGFHLSLLCHVNLFSCGRLSSPASFLGHGFLPSLNFSSQSRESGARCELVSYHGLVLISHSLYSCVDIPSFLFASLSPLLCFAAPCFLSQSQVGVASFCLPYSLTSKEHPPSCRPTRPFRCQIFVPLSSFSCFRFCLFLSLSLAALIASLSSPSPSPSLLRPLLRLNINMVCSFLLCILLCVMYKEK